MLVRCLYDYEYEYEYDYYYRNLADAPPYLIERRARPRPA